MTSGAKTGSRFNPSPQERIVLKGDEYVFLCHPQIPSMVLASEGARATVYKSRKSIDSKHHALKVFKKAYRTPDLFDSARRLTRVEAYAGFRAAKRFTLSPNDPSVRAQPDLEYAILMPWLDGKTWFDILVEASTDGSPYNRAGAVYLCRRFLQVMSQVESGGMAHSDIAPGNVIITYEPPDV